MAKIESSILSEPTNEYHRCSLRMVTMSIAIEIMNSQSSSDATCSGSGSSIFATGGSSSSVNVKSVEPPSQRRTSSDSSKDSSGMDAFGPSEYTDGSRGVPLHLGWLVVQQDWVAPGPP